MVPVIIRANNCIHFKTLIAQLLWPALEEPGVLALGAVDEEGLAVCALLVRLDSAGTAELLWLFTAENRRREGAASVLLDALRRAMGRCGQRRLLCLLEDTPAADSLIPLLLARGFSATATDEPLLHVPLSALRERLHPRPAVRERCLLLENLPASYLRQVGQTLPPDDFARLGPLAQLPLRPEHFHPCSCAYVGAGRVEGLLLFAKAELSDRVTLLWAAAWSATPGVLTAMLETAAVRAAEVCQPDALFTWATLNDLGESVLEALALPPHTSDVLCLSLTCS